MDAKPATPSVPLAHSEFIKGVPDEMLIRDAAVRGRRALGGRADLALLFISCDLEGQLSDLIELVQIHAHCTRVVGCSAGGFILTGQEEENAGGVTLMLLKLPDTEVCVLPLSAYPGGDEWEQVSRWSRDERTGWLLLGNPMQLGEEWMSHWNKAAGRTSVYGGLASGSSQGEELFLFTEQGRTDEAAIAIGLRGRVRITGLVSQGCRPIGQPLTITKADQNKIHQLASRSAYDQLQSAYQSLPEPLRDRAQGNILVGLAMTEYVEEFHRGDFLVRSILGGDPDKGVLAVGALPRVGQTLQFQLRDKESAHEDLATLLEYKRESMPPPFAALLFNCGGRGEQLFGEPNHDAALFEETFGGVPLAGFFCNGEIGTVGAKAYLHAFTACGAFLVADPVPFTAADD